MPFLALIWSSASWAPINSFLPSAAKVPVSGLSRPILTGSSASDFTTNGLATCMAPIARPALSSVRRLTGTLIRSLDIFFLSLKTVLGVVVKAGHLWLNDRLRSIKRMSHYGAECNANSRVAPVTAWPRSPFLAIGVRRDRQTGRYSHDNVRLGDCRAIVRQMVRQSAAAASLTRRATPSAAQSWLTANERAAPIRRLVVGGQPSWRRHTSSGRRR